MGITKVMAKSSECHSEVKIPSKMTLMSPTSDMTGMDQITDIIIVMFGPISSTYFKGDEAQPKYTW